MPCDNCVLRADPQATPLGLFLEELRSCEDCLLRSGPTADPLAVSLVTRLLEAGAERR